jgi:xanthine dehydrogenase accessory factor
VCVDAVEDEVRHAPRGAHYLVLTHNHDLDLRITEAILRRGDFAYLGLIGSKTKRERFVHRFEQRGIAPDAIARLTCPIGIEGIDGKEPAVIAVAVVAQLLRDGAART